MSQTVERALSILRFVSDGPRSLTDVAEHLGVHKSTALRLLQTLEKEDTVRQQQVHRYVLGFGVISLAEKALNQIDLRSVAHGPLQRLAESISHTVHLAQIIDRRVIYMDKIDGDGTVAMGSRIGLSAELHTAAVAKVILSFLGDAQLSRLLDHHDFLRHTPTTITSREALQAELHVTRKRGWAEDKGEKEDYINCVALPLFDASGRVTLGISVTALRAAAPLEELRELIPLISGTAHEISRELGWKGDVRGFE